MSLKRINIRPGVSVLSVLPHLNYKPWYALAEFVDNALQSAHSKKRQIEKLTEEPFRLRVDINFDSSINRITIKDNAGGIAEDDYERAFRPAELPPDASGLSEFGMGMKSAACWFSPKWHVRSSALGETEERTVFFEIEKIVYDSIEELDIIRTNVNSQSHYTEVVLEEIRKFPKGKTIKKIHDHLASIYRIFIRDGLLDLYINDEKLTYDPPAILKAPSYKEPESEKIEWKKTFFTDLGEGKSAEGFVAIREKGDTRLAGLSLFRRGRLILGSADEGYKPEEIFGRPNSFASQRLFGEVHLKGFQVSHTKDGFKWEESEERFLKELKSILSEDSLPLLQQAREYRATGGAKTQRRAAFKALNDTVSDLRKRHIDEIDDVEISAIIKPAQNNNKQDNAESKRSEKADTETIKISFREEKWIINIHLSYEEDGSEWLEIRNKPCITDAEPRGIDIKLSMAHPFMDRFAAKDSDTVEPLIRIGASMALAEVLAVESGRTSAASVRDLFNQILRTSFS